MSELCVAKNKSCTLFIINQKFFLIEKAWNIIQTHATKVLAISQLKNILNKNLRNRKLKRRFSFTRSVSREIFERQNSRNSLHDGATPIVVLEDEDTDLDNNEVEGVFEQNQTITNLKINK